MTIPWFFREIQTGEKTGLAVFTREPVVKKVHLVHGDIVFASSNLSEDRLGEWLHRTGTITRTQSDASAELVKKTGKRQGDILISLGFITPDLLMDGIRYQIRQIIISLFNWRDGSYLFDESSLPDDDGVSPPINTLKLIIEGLHGTEWSVVRKSLPSLKSLVLPNADQANPVQGSDLEQDQRAVLSLIDGSRSIEELCLQSSIGDYNTLMAIYALLALRMVNKGALKAGVPTKPGPEAAHAAIELENISPVEPQAVEVLSKEALLEAHKRLAHQNHYEILGVGLNASAQELQKAYFSLAKHYHPDRHFGPALSEIIEILTELFNAIHNAYETLTDPDKRARYNRVLESGIRSTQTKERTPEEEKQANKAAAAAHFKEGMRYFTGGNFWDAEEAFQWAVRFDPSRAEYVIHRALALSRLPRRGRDAEEYFLKAIIMEPLNIGYYLKLVDFYMRLGMKTKALAVYQDAVQRKLDAEQIKEAISIFDGLKV